MPMKSCAGKSKPRNISKLSRNAMRLRTSIASVYIARFKTRAMAATAPGMPSFIISTMAAGCPPAADGVISEKYMSVAA